MKAIVLTDPKVIFKIEAMEVRFKPETELRLQELASKSGRPTDDLIEDAMAGYLAEVVQVRSMLDSRYEDFQSGRVKPIHGEAFFEGPRQREDELLKKQSPK
jgi:predicted transcriptional regulator